MHDSESFDEPSKETLKTLIKKKLPKNTRTAELESVLAQLRIKVSQLERYQSKDCLIFSNLQFSSNETYLSDVINYIQNVLNFNIEPRDLKAYHPLGRGWPFNPSPAIAKFV